jgi:hypothetical protein
MTPNSSRLDMPSVCLGWKSRCTSLPSLCLWPRGLCVPSLSDIIYIISLVRVPLLLLMYITHVAPSVPVGLCFVIVTLFLDVNCLHVRVLLLIYTSSNSHSSPLMPLAHGYKNLADVPLCSVPHLSSFCALRRTIPSA